MQCKMNSLLALVAANMQSENAITGAPHGDSDSDLTSCAFHRADSSSQCAFPCVIRFIIRCSGPNTNFRQLRPVKLQVLCFRDFLQDSIRHSHHHLDPVPFDPSRYNKVSQLFFHSHDHSSPSQSNFQRINTRSSTRPTTQNAVELRPSYQKAQTFPRRSRRRGL